MQVEAQLLAGAKLAEGVKRAQTGGSGWIHHVPICSGQAYNVSDGKPYNPQRMMDDIFERLGEQHTINRQTASGHLPGFLEISANSFKDLVGPCDLSDVRGLSLAHLPAFCACMLVTSKIFQRRSFSECRGCLPWYLLVWRS